MDIELMKRLAPRVNVIPVIGKSDTLTPKELREFKKRASRIEEFPEVKSVSSRRGLAVVRSWRISSTTVFLFTTSLMTSKRMTRIPSLTTASCE
jgi:hypothetical protein